MPQESQYPTVPPLVWHRRLYPWAASSWLVAVAFVLLLLASNTSSSTVMWSLLIGAAVVLAVRTHCYRRIQMVLAVQSAALRRQTYQLLSLSVGADYHSGPIGMTVKTQVALVYAQGEETRQICCSLSECRWVDRSDPGVSFMGQRLKWVRGHEKLVTKPIFLIMLPETMLAAAYESAGGAFRWTSDSTDTTAQSDSATTNLGEIEATSA
jgi:hypothetical protein